MKKILIILLIIGLFNGCLFHHPNHRGYHSDGYDNRSYRNTSQHYEHRESRHNNYNRRDNNNYRNHGDARMNVTRHN